MRNVRNERYAYGLRHVYVYEWRHVQRRITPVVNQQKHSVGSLPVYMHVYLQNAENSKSMFVMSIHA